ncbi:hypothetical protein PC116_g29785 [Phytophthora cactorum]|nr:hypothetical protein PC116_g29785 [Phytophthora cactorum]
MDSSRLRGKSVVRPSLTIQPPPSEDIHAENDELNYTWQHDYNNGNNYSGDFTPAQLEPSPQNYFPPGTSPQTSYYDFQDGESHAPVYIPPPEVPRQSELSEKERIRQAEQRLLPSQPPVQPEESEAGPSQPSAPIEESVHQINGNHNFNSHASPTEREEEVGGPSAPTLADLTSTGPPSSSNVDDKQELERRRLLQEASAPPEVPEDYEGTEPSAPALDPPRTQEPSAPVLNDDHDYGSLDPYHDIAGPSGRAAGSEPLPRYER